MAVALSPRTTAVGASLSFLVLAAGRDACIGVDVASGAFVLARWPASAANRLGLFDVAAGRVAPVQAEDPLERREAVVLSSAPRAVGSMRRREVERYLRPLLLPAREHLLGSARSSAPYWMVPTDRPSVCLVAPPGGVSVEGGVSRFWWRGVHHELPVAAAGARTEGFVPHRLVVAWTPPRAGVCHKVVTALLP